MGWFEIGFFIASLVRRKEPPMQVEWYYWLSAVAAIASIIAAIVRIRAALKKADEPTVPVSNTVLQRGRFNQNIIVNGGASSSTVDVTTNIKERK